ncbi:hypothetical protein PVAND_011353 [Polypedilum vanderplanki]|uniref:Uncharacterized protein n=1 Tax=Polypedilum vanderplanki TaxID=319348 RepID=A0A9J6CJ67_POLVA|nr:hypothetical protein PVAND_011353 [Polypedilum vanderplanki]
MAAETKLKAGKTSMKKLKRRYTKHEKYKQLTENSIFWTGKDQLLALKIEAATIKVLRAKDVCANSGKDTENNCGSLANVKHRMLFAVYLTTMKPPEDRCIFCNNAWYSTGKRRHYEEKHKVLGLEYERAIEELREQNLTSAELKLMKNFEEIVSRGKMEYD